MSDGLGSYPHFRLNLEQQQTRAKELVRAARAGDASALAKFRRSPPKLAEAQFALARELRFENWAELKRHVAAMTRERSRLEPANAPVETSPLALDGDLRTLHIRCGSDLRRPLQDAGFRGDFYEHSYPYLIGPVRGLGFTQQMALTMLAEQPHSLNRMFGRMTYFLDPLPGQGDSQVRDRVLSMELARERVFTREPSVDREGRARPPWTDVLTLTDLGRAVLAGEADFESLAPPPRWVGGVRISNDDVDWRWDESRRDARPGPAQDGR
jgi:hypothetical protein